MKLTVYGAGSRLALAVLLRGSATFGSPAV